MVAADYTHIVKVKCPEVQMTIPVTDEFIEMTLEERDDFVREAFLAEVAKQAIVKVELYIKPRPIKDNPQA